MLRIFLHGLPSLISCVDDINTAFFISQFPNKFVVSYQEFNKYKNAENTVKEMLNTNYCDRTQHGWAFYWNVQKKIML